MNIRYLSDESFEEFRTKFPGAYYFLAGENIKGERKELERELKSPAILPIRKDWIVERLDWLKQCIGE